MVPTRNHKGHHREPGREIPVAGCSPVRQALRQPQQFALTALAMELARVGALALVERVSRSGCAAITDRRGTFPVVRPGETAWRNWT